MVNLALADMAHLQSRLRLSYILTIYEVLYKYMHNCKFYPKEAKAEEETEEKAGEAEAVVVVAAAEKEEEAKEEAEETEKEAEE